MFIPVTIISATNLTTPTANAAVTIDQCVALNDKGRDAGSISKETYENSGVCNIMRRYTNLDKEEYFDKHLAGETLAGLSKAFGERVFVASWRHEDI